MQQLRALGGRRTGVEAEKGSDESCSVLQLLGQHTWTLWEFITAFMLPGWEQVGNCVQGAACLCTRCSINQEAYRDTRRHTPAH